MFKFFTQKKWFLWSILGSLFILISTWYQVQLDVRINEWFGEFYDTLQKALTTPNSVSENEFIGYLKGTIIKYTYRYPDKAGHEDLEKAVWFINKLRDQEGSNETDTTE